MKKLALVLAAVMVMSCMMIVPTAATSGADVLASADMYLTFEDNSYADTKGNYTVVTSDTNYETPEAVFAAEGKFGGSIETTAASFLTVEGLDFTGSFTLTTWVRIDFRDGGDPAVFGNKDWSSGSNDGLVVFSDGGTLRLDAIGNGDRIKHDFPNDYNDIAGTGEWVHLAIVIDKDTNTQTIYYNGVPSFKDIISWSGDTLESDYPLNIGNDGSGFYGSNDGFGASFDEFAFFKKALSMDEVHAIYTYAPEGYEAATAPEVNLPDYSAPLTYTADPAAVVAAADLYLVLPVPQ